MTINHKAEAELGLVRIAQHSMLWSDEQRATELRAAQVHATLYLAEQQRVANLIALASIEGLDVSKPWAAGFYESLRLDIARLLGLGGESDG